MVKRVLPAAILAVALPLLVAIAVDQGRIWDALQAGAVLGTGVVVYWYTRETQRLRESSEAQSLHAGEQAAHALVLAESAGGQLRIAEEGLRLQRAAIAAGYRPMLVAELREREVVVTNIGSGPALGLFARFRDEHSRIGLPMVPVLAEHSEVSLPLGDLDAEASGDVASALLVFALSNQTGTHTPWPVLDIEYRDLADTPHATVSVFRKKGPGDVVAYGLHRNAQRRFPIVTTQFAQAPGAQIDPIDSSS